MNLRPIYWNYNYWTSQRKSFNKKSYRNFTEIQFNPKNCASFCGICREYFRYARDPKADLCSPRNNTSIINGELAICCLASTTIRLNCIKQMCCSIVVLNANFLIKIFEQCESPEGGDENSLSLNSVMKLSSVVLWDLVATNFYIIRHKVENITRV